MKISDQNSMAPARVGVKKTEVSNKTECSGCSSGASPDASAPIVDRVELSSVKEQMDAIRSEFEKIPDVRTDVVEKAQNEIASGVYWDTRSPEAIVSAMIGHFKKYA